ncbi:MAG: IS200/IS605 family transposase [Anaerolineae bacterium]|nr:IS200/IS605 family transposase [Anaerolineae bacterium]NUQ07094.1 IS200/IS605 family transposase [Anaerolineae bacterium]
MAFWNLFYHVIWATRDRAPLLMPEVERVALGAIERKSNALQCPIHAINGAGDHVHVAVSIPPKIAVADWVRQIKGVSSREVNAAFPDLEIAFAWQNSYGVLSFGVKHLPIVTAYIVNQKAHHADHQLVDYLERLED